MTDFIQKETLLEPIPTHKINGLLAATALLQAEYSKLNGVMEQLKSAQEAITGAKKVIRDFASETNMTTTPEGEKVKAIPTFMTVVKLATTMSATITQAIRTLSPWSDSLCGVECDDVMSATQNIKQSTESMFFVNSKALIEAGMGIDKKGVKKALTKRREHIKLNRSQFASKQLRELIVVFFDSEGNGITYDTRIEKSNTFHTTGTHTFAKVTDLHAWVADTEENLIAHAISINAAKVMVDFSTELRDWQGYTKARKGAVTLWSNPVNQLGENLDMLMALEDI